MKSEGSVSIPADDLNSEQKQVLLDITQFCLDMAGILDPTPVSDATSALLSIGRGDWMGAGIGAISMLPYLGDTAKLSKFPKYKKSLDRAISLAGKDQRYKDLCVRILGRIDRLLDDVPAKHLPPEFHKLRQELDKFLGPLVPRLPTPESVKLIYDKLPETLQGQFMEAMKSPIVRRCSKSLRKHPEQLKELLKEEDLLRELREKRFIQVKKGQHELAGGEDSDIYIRHIVDDDNRHYFEAVRVDRKATQDQYELPKRSKDKAKSWLQSDAKPFRREHQTLSETQTGQKTDTTRMLAELDRGVFKGAFSHWHHEKFPFSAENLAHYLTIKDPRNPVPGIKLLDPLGQVVERKYPLPF